MLLEAEHRAGWLIPHRSPSRTQTLQNKKAIVSNQQTTIVSNQQTPDLKEPLVKLILKCWKPHSLYAKSALKKNAEKPMRGVPVYVRPPRGALYSHPYTQLAWDPKERVDKNKVAPVIILNLYRVLVVPNNKKWSILPKTSLTMTWKGEANGCTEKGVLSSNQFSWLIQVQCCLCYIDCGCQVRT